MSERTASIMHESRASKPCDDMQPVGCGLAFIYTRQRTDRFSEFDLLTANSNAVEYRPTFITTIGVARILSAGVHFFAKKS